MGLSNLGLENGLYGAYSRLAAYTSERRRNGARPMAFKADPIVNQIIYKYALCAEKVVRETLQGRLNKLREEIPDPAEFEKQKKLLEDARKRAECLGREASNEMGYRCPVCWVEYAKENTLSGTDMEPETARLKCSFCGLSSLWEHYQLVLEDGKRIHSLPCKLPEKPQL